MRRVDSSWTALLLGVAVIALVAGALLLPWFTAEHTTGRRNPPGGLTPPEDTGAIHTGWTAGAGAASGDQPPADPAGHQQWVSLVGWLTGGAGLLALLVVLGEVPGARRLAVRRVSLAASLLAMAGLAGAAVVGWFLIPSTYGLGDGPFVAMKVDDGYWRTSLGLGWACAALAAPLAVGAFLAKFQAGSGDPEAAEDMARRMAVKP